ncbi:hypothetical protein [Micromonospora echinofusca]|uniref:hypothetical protein n=1 Tax=Micromonospora echinofusca TaxID=47858 RepID=UPI0012FE40D7|nr:hypothetical protein [Micromonospora echinofusca]
MRASRAVLSILSSILIGLSIVVPAAPAAAASCAGAGCNGKMAAAQGCTADAFVIVGFTLNDPDVSAQPHGDLWYSPTCRAMWADFNVPEASTLISAQLWTQPEYGGMNQLAASSNLSEGNWTSSMVDWQQSVKFCGSHKGTDPDMDLPSGGYNACTAWR